MCRGPREGQAAQAAHLQSLSQARGVEAAVRALRSHTEREGVLGSVCGWVQPQLTSDRAAPRPAVSSD